jgi:DNA-directed RNA polymerase subunit RPC12/RpoP
MKTQVKYFCHMCSKQVEPIRLGRAHYECPLCSTDMTLSMIYQLDLMNEPNFNSKNKIDERKVE